LAITSTFPLQAPSSAISLQALSSFANGVSAKWGEVGRRGEVSTREVVGGKSFEVEKRLKKPKTLRRGGCGFGSSPKRLEQPHPQLVHWWLLVHSSPKQVPCRFSLNLPLFGLGPSSKDFGTNLKLLTNKIAWIHWSSDLGPSSKVGLRLYSPDYIDPSETPGITKGLGFKTQWFAIETPVEPLPVSLTWGCQRLVWLGLLLCFHQKQNPIKLNSWTPWVSTPCFFPAALPRPLIAVLWLPWFGGKKQPSNYQCWVGRTLAYRLLRLLVVSSKSGKFGPFFCMKNPFYSLKSYFSGLNLMRILSLIFMPVLQQHKTGKKKLRKEHSILNCDQYSLKIQ
jgi:hypothetical protein